jgi:transketolase
MRFAARGSGGIEETPMDPHTPWQDRARELAQAIRLRVFRFVMANGGGYLSQACSSAELFATLYTKVMRLGPSTAPMVPRPYAGPPGRANPGYTTGAGYNGPRGVAYDRFIFSPSHYALVLYATLVETGRMAEEGLAQFNTDGSTVEMIGAEHSPGCETSTGSLGQGISHAGGIAMARRIRGESGRVWALLTDGEFQEGQLWEAVQAMVHYRLDNVGVYVDVNGQQCDGAIRAVMTTEPIGARLAAFGARVEEVDGHDVEALARPAGLAPDGRPLFVLARTDPCRGIPLLEARRPKLHYLRFSSDEERQQYQATLEGMLAASGARS